MVKIKIKIKKSKIIYKPIKSHKVFVMYNININIIDVIRSTFGNLLLLLLLLLIIINY